MQEYQDNENSRKSRIENLTIENNERNSNRRSLRIKINMKKESSPYQYNLENSVKDEQDIYIGQSDHPLKFQNN